MSNQETKRPKTAYEIWIQSKSLQPFSEWRAPEDMKKELEDAFKDKDKSS